LPLNNRYIRRMQATYALIDYLGIAMQQGEPSGSVWRDLGTPVREDFPGWRPVDINRVKSTGATFPLSFQQWNNLKSDATRGAPPGNQYAGKNWLQGELRRVYLVNQLAALLKDPSRAEDLAAYLSRALSLPREEVENLLWEHPRPLLLTVVPTALRRLATNWRAHGEPYADRKSRVASARVHPRHVVQ
jgi:hypothetical protein